MSVYRVRGSHLKLIAWHQSKYSIRGGAGLLFTFLVLTVGLLIAGIIITPVEALRERIREGDYEEREEPFGRPAGVARPPAKPVAPLNEDEVTARVVEKVADAASTPVKWALGVDDEHVSYLLQEKPALVSAVMIVLMWALPFLIVFGAFNQFSGDIQHKGFRYLLLRTERANIFFGRFIGTYVFAMLLLLLLLGVIYVYLAAKIRFYSAGAIGVWLLQGFMAMAMLSLPYVALCAWLSAAIDSPFGCLAISGVIVGFVPIFAAFGAKAFEGIKYVGYVLPWPLKFELLHPSPAHVMGAAVAMLGYTVVFLALGASTFQKRDL